MALYPESRHAASASYYTIRPGYNAREDVDRWAADLTEYLARYGDTNTIEATYARSDLASIYDALWQLLTFQYETAEARNFITDDGAADAKRAHEYRILAQRLYTDYLLFGGPGYRGAAKRSRALRRGEEDSSVHIWYD